MSEPANKPQLEFSMLHDEHPLRIEATAGSSRCLIVCFTSVGTKRNAWPPKEFVGMSSQKGRNHVIFVTDISRCWMNSVDMMRKVTTIISDYILQNGITSIHAIGTSMGAYNALLLGLHMPLSRIIAFTPQYSVHPEVMPHEQRWLWFRKQIEVWPYKEMNKLPDEPTTIFMFHGDTPDERMHWERFGKAENLKHFIFGGADHSFIRKLKEAKVLEKIVLAGLNNRPGRMGKVVGRAGGLRRSEYEAFNSAVTYFDDQKKVTRPQTLDS